MASDGGKIWMKHGALEYWEVGKTSICQILQNQRVQPFAKRFNRKPTDTVLFSWIIYRSKAHRNQVNKKVMADPLEYGALK